MHAQSIPSPHQHNRHNTRSRAAHQRCVNRAHFHHCSTQKPALSAGYRARIVSAQTNNLVQFRLILSQPALQAWRNVRHVFAAALPPHHFLPISRAHIRAGFPASKNVVHLPVLPLDTTSSCSAGTQAHRSPRLSTQARRSFQRTRSCGRPGRHSSEKRAPSHLRPADHNSSRWSPAGSVGGRVHRASYRSAYPGGFPADCGSFPATAACCAPQPIRPPMAAHPDEHRSPQPPQRYPL